MTITLDIPEEPRLHLFARGNCETPGCTKPSTGPDIFGNPSCDDCALTQTDWQAAA